MKITVKPSEAIPAIALAQTATDPRGPMAILRDVRITTLSGPLGQMIEVVGTTLEHSIRTTFPCEFDHPGGLVANPSELTKRLRVLGDKAQLSLDSGSLKMRSGKTRFTMSVHGQDEFPSVADPETTASLIVDAASLRDVISRGGYCCSQGSSESVSCAFLVASGGKLSVMSTDGHRAAIAEVEQDGELDAEITWSRVPHILRMLESADGTVELASNETWLTLKFGDVFCAMKRFRGACPPLTQIIRAQSTSIDLETEQLRRAISTVGVSSASADDSGKGMNRRDPPIVITFGNGIQLDAKHHSLGDGHTEIECETGLKSPVSIGFNGRYLLDALASCGDTVALSFNPKNPLDPVVYVSGSCTGCVMPQRL